MFRFDENCVATGNGPMTREVEARGPKAPLGEMQAKLRSILNESADMATHAVVELGGEEAVRSSTAPSREDPKSVVGEVEEALRLAETIWSRLNELMTILG